MVLETYTHTSGDGGVYICPTFVHKYNTNATIMLAFRLLETFFGAIKIEVQQQIMSHYFVKLEIMSHYFVKLKIMSHYFVKLEIMSHYFRQSSKGKELAAQNNESLF
jgi:hypothetical protein